MENTREAKLKEQTELLHEITYKAKINIVTCGNCGDVLLHRIENLDIECPYCDFNSEPCDFPDLFY